MMYFKSEGELFRRKDNRSPFEIYGDGKWETYKYLRDNLFVNSVELDKPEAAKLKRQLDAEDSEGKE